MPIPYTVLLLSVLSQIAGSEGRYSPIHRLHYNQLKGKKSNAFYDKHFAEIQEYEKARDYIKAVLNGRTDIPVKKWEAELVKLTATRHSLCEDYYRLRDDTRNIELIRKGAENIMREDVSKAQPQRVHGIEL